MKRALLALLSITASTVSLFGQITFEKTYRKLPSVEIAKTCDNDGYGGYIIGVGEKSINSTSRTDAILRINAYGDTLWYYSFQLPNNANLQMVRNSQDGGFYAMGIKLDSTGNNTYMLWVFKLDSAGNKIWNRNFSDIDIHPDGNSMKIKQDGSIFLNIFSVYLMSISPIGNLDTLRTIPFVTNVTFPQHSNFLEYDSSWYYIGDYNFTLPYRIMKANYLGDTVASIPIMSDTGRSALDILKVSENFYYTCSFAQPIVNGKHPFTFTKFDSLGYKLWNKFYNFLNYPAGIPTVYTSLSNGTNIVSIIPNTNGFNPPTGKAAIFCFNDNGDSLWYKTFSPTDTAANTELFDVIATPDSGLLAVGQIKFSNGQQKSYLIKLDANGNLFNPLSIVEKNKETYLHLYPNPANTYTCMHYMGVEKNAILNICNLQGQIIYSQKIESSDERITINIAQFGAGFYLLNISTNGKILANRKLVVIN